MESKSMICPACGSPMLMRRPGTTCPRCLLRVCMAEAGGGDSFDSTMPAPREAPGTVIGRYTLIDEIGEGGFGIVYLAEQAAPVRRKVALKVLKPGMDTREVVARFKVERQALALMDHPHIAQVYDGGATDSGRPYFVMELVNGTPITEYCVEHRLSIRQRLDLFLDVTSAVQHAHQKGIIHRDIKPSNILVSAQDGHPVVKVIDFGVAKAVAMNLTESAVLTALGRMIGTPEYMSPEQADLNTIDVDTRSDIYSLGVVLYELLTGIPPLNPSVLRDAGFTEMLRIIREDKPPNPSSRNSDLRQSRGRELDWVVMQALEKDPARRYQTANGFGLDVRRFLNDEPVSASPPSAAYRFSKFAKRHRAGVAWTCVFAVVVIAAVIGLMLSAEKARTNAWNSYMRLAGELRWSRKPEGRYNAFRALQDAATLPGQLKAKANLKWLRDSVIACLSIVDMRPVDAWTENGYVEMVAADRQLTMYATSFPDGRISIHRYHDHSLVRDLPGDGEPVTGVLRFSLDGTCLAAAYGTDSDWKLKLWNPLSEAPAIEAGAGVHRAFDFFPDGKHCAVGRPGGSIAIIDTASGGLLREHVLTDKGEPYSLAVSGRGKWIAVGIGGNGSPPARVGIFDAETGTASSPLMCPARAVAWSPIDDSLAVGCADGSLRVWHDQDWGSNPIELLDHTKKKEIDAVTWSPDGRLLASQRQDGTVSLWDPFQGGAELCWRRGMCSDLGFNKDGTRLGIFREGKTLTVMEVASGDVCYRGRRHSGNVGVFDGAWNVEGTLLATSGDDGVRLWNREGRQKGFLEIPRARGVGFSADYLFIASDRGLQRWPMEGEMIDGELVITFQAPELIGSFKSCGQISMSADKDLLALACGGSGSNDKASIQLIDPRNGALLQRLAAPARVNYCAISRDRKWLAAGTLKGNDVRIWSLGDTAAPVDLEIHGTAKVAFSWDSTRLVTGDSLAYRFWEAGSWKQEREISNEMGGSSGMMAFSPRKTVLIVACRGAELKVYDPTGTMELASPDFDRETPLCFDPDGRIMITTGQSGGIFFWRLDRVRSHFLQLTSEWNLPEPGLDWKAMPIFKDCEWPEVKRIVLPEAGS